MKKLDRTKVIDDLGLQWREHRSERYCKKSIQLIERLETPAQWCQVISAYNFSKNWTIEKCKIGDDAWQSSWNCFYSKIEARRYAAVQRTNRRITFPWKRFFSWNILRSTIETKRKRQRFWSYSPSFCWF